MQGTLQVGEIAAPRGQSAMGLLRIGELADGCTPMHIPVMILNGAGKGPVLYLHGGSHGQETISVIEAMRRLRVELDAAQMCGAVIMVPVANMLAHQAGTRIAPQYGVREGGPFGGDLHRLWPGDRHGSMTQRVAHAIWQHIVLQADCVLDFHTNSNPGLAFSLMHENERTDAEGRKVWKRTIHMAQAFGLTMAREAPCPTTLAGASLAAGKPAITVEIPTPRVIDQAMVEATVLGCKNVMVHMGILNGEIRPQTGVLVLEGDYDNGPSPRADHGGVIHFEAACGPLIPAGTVIARIFDVFGNEVESIHMPKDGYISTFPPMSWNAQQAVATGEWVADLFYKTPPDRLWIDA